VQNFGRLPALDMTVVVTLKGDEDEEYEFPVGTLSPCHEVSVDAGELSGLQNEALKEADEVTVDVYLRDSAGQGWKRSAEGGPTKVNRSCSSTLSC
jgi:hypothetical protein